MADQSRGASFAETATQTSLETAGSAITSPRLNIRSKIGRWLNNYRRNVIIFFMTMLITAVYFLPAAVVFIPAGQGGVLWKRFQGGTQLASALPEGINLIWPWNKVAVYDLRLREDTRAYMSIANDGLVVHMDLTFRYRLEPSYLGHLHKLLGPEYLNTLIVPQIASTVREVISRYKSDELYSSRRRQIQEEIFDQLADNLMYVGIIDSPHPQPIEFGADVLNGFIIIQDVLIRRIELPEMVVHAIENKVQQDQLAQQYQFRLQRESLEAERKRVEAGGIRKFQNTINANLTNNYLNWRGIEATVELARSASARFVIIGQGAQGSPPVILNTGSGLETKTTVTDGQLPPVTSPPKLAQSADKIVESPALVSPNPAPPEPPKNTTPQPIPPEMGANPATASSPPDQQRQER